MGELNFCFCLGQMIVLGFAILALIKIHKAERRIESLEEVQRGLAAKLQRLLQSQENAKPASQAQIIPVKQAIHDNALPPMQPPPLSKMEPAMPPIATDDEAKIPGIEALPGSIPIAPPSSHSTEPTGASAFKPELIDQFSRSPIAPPAEPPALKIVTPPKPKITFEESFGRAIIWVAGLALALAVGYLVKYSYDNHLVSPAMRISMGALVAVIFVAAGDWMRFKSNRIAQSLTAAGIAGMFAVLLAAMHVEDLLDAKIGFILMALTAGAAVFLSLRQGPFVALLGLAGGFATPLLVGSNDHNPGGLFGYLFVLQLALVAVTRRRGWMTLMLLTLLSGYAWTIAWLCFFFRAGDETVLGLFVLATSACFALAPAGLMAATATDENTSQKNDWHPRVGEIIRWIGAGTGLVLTGVLLNVGNFTGIEWGFVWIISAGCVVISRLDRRSLGLGFFSAAAGAVLLLTWLDHNPTGSDRVLFSWMVLALGLLHAVGFYVSLWKSNRVGLWTTMSVLSALVYFFIAKEGVQWLPFEHFWGTLCLVLAALYAVAGLPLEMRRDRMEGAEKGMAALWVGAATFLALAAPIELKREWITVAWAMLTPMVLGIGQKMRVPALRWVSVALAVLVGARLLLNPEVLSYPTGTTPIFNWILYGYGIPVIALAITSKMLWSEKSELPAMAVFFESISITLLIALVSLEVRHYFHPQNLGIAKLTFHELAVALNLWFIIALALLWAGVKIPHQSFHWASNVVFHLALTLTVFGSILILNPIWNGQATGSMIALNWLLVAYALPMCWCIINAAIQQQSGDAKLAKQIAATALVLLLVWVSMETRHVYHGSILSGAMSDAENYTYSAVWLVLGSALLVSGILKPSNLLRWASIPVTMLAAVKVFVWDVRHLPDLWRVVSFMGLGIVLLILAYLYQRFVFKRTV